VESEHHNDIPRLLPDCFLKIPGHLAGIAVFQQDGTVFRIGLDKVGGYPQSLGETSSRFIHPA
jgi:hypothetical protein